MHKVDGREAVQQLQDAWRDAALGKSTLAKEHIHEALDSLDELIALRRWPAARLRAVRGYMEEARAAVLRSDELGMILATVAALQELGSYRA
jgi:hypothetical protein